jgi:predicted DCC family thiol-disulfide oxidoreductase YuxK
MKAEWYPLTVFYNGSSPSCAREVDPLKRLEHGGRLVFVDCSAPDFDEGVLAGISIARRHLLSSVHARDAHGRWHTGMAAIEAAYHAAHSNHSVASEQLS